MKPKCVSESFKEYQRKKAAKKREEARLEKGKLAPVVTPGEVERRHQAELEANGQQSIFDAISRAVSQ